LAPSPLRVFFLWHFHQPWYVPFDGESAPLPWVRLHALKDYAALPALLAASPRVPHAANLVPALLDQVAMAAGGASDAFLEVARTPVSQWDAGARRFALENFFSVNDLVLARSARYLDLKAHADAGAPFSEADLRDLVVHFHLAWSSPDLLKDPLLVHLRKRGHAFTEDEKTALLDRQTAALSGVIPAWKAAFASGNVEAATSPYHHPILPLLSDSDVARQSLPAAPLPSPRFSRPEDARAQIALGLSTFERHFGFRPKGMWPPEGALSETALALLGEAGVSWVATDEALLFHSPPVSRQSFGEGDRARLLFRPWRLPGVSSPAVFFRDRVLSDRIGFSYATWNAADAAADFVARLLSIRAAAPEAELAVPVILDGENAWETYPDNGEPFLRALTSALEGRQDIRVVTPSQALAEVPATPLEGFVAGSWVNGTLATWIGSPAKNRAWTLLASAREALAGFVAAAPVVAPAEVLAGRAEAPAAAKAALFAAEASDWFWWFGDDNTSAHDAVFDELFRRHLAAAYRAAGRPVPAALLEPVDPSHAPAFETPIVPLWPNLDGGDEAGWAGAGRVAARTRGTMHRAAGLVKEMLFGASASGDPLFLRLEPSGETGAPALLGLTLRVELLVAGASEPVAFEALVSPGVTDVNGARIALGGALEARLPLGVPRAGALVFRVRLLDAKGRVAEAIPADGWLRFTPPGPASSAGSLLRSKAEPAP
jgi:alpha-amylase/alpha-mannosidase (GH57 family)